MKTSDVCIFVILAFMIGLLILVIVVDVLEKNPNYIYECTDYKGDLIYCRQAYVFKGGMYGETEDGITITITSYKRILKKDMKLKE
jgi:hypothetical protein